MNAKIQAIEKEITDGGGSQAYRECIASKYRSEAWLEHRKRLEGGVYTTHRLDGSSSSGLAADTEVFRIPTWNVLVEQYGETEPADRGLTELLENDAALFSPAWPGIVLSNRPLPGGTYKFYYHVYPQSLIICDGRPEEYKKRSEVFISVTAPDGTLHEAFFDPVSSGDAVGYFGTGDALKPTNFSIGDVSTAIQSLKYEDSAVTLGLSPYNALAGQILDFITGDGTTTLSLEASAATGDSTAGTLTWAVGSQPWSSGDQLMLRIRDSNTPPTFAQDSYTFSVAESTSAFTVIGTVKAVDQDGDTVLHKITAGNEGGRFSIDGWEGFILVSGQLDYETKSSYELTVTGTDPGGRSATTTATINVTDVAE